MQIGLIKRIWPQEFTVMQHKGKQQKVEDLFCSDSSKEDGWFDNLKSLYQLNLICAVSECKQFCIMWKKER